MLKTISLFILLLIAAACPLLAQTDDEEGSYATQVPPGMVLKNIGGSHVVVPKGTAVRREGDLRIVEGAGEYAARKFIEYDAIIAKMQSDIAAVQKDVEEIKNSLSESRSGALVSK